MKHELAFQAHTIIAVGDLNPAIFQPAWFAAEGLITREEAQAAKVDGHYRLESNAQWTYVSDQLAPKTRWSGLLESPVMRSLTMESPRMTGPKGNLQVRVEPSVRITNGVFVDVNNHYDVSHEEAGCRAMLSVLSRHWIGTFVNYKDVLSRIFPDG